MRGRLNAVIKAPLSILRARSSRHSNVYSSGTGLSSSGLPVNKRSAQTKIPRQGLLGARRVYKEGFSSRDTSRISCFAPSSQPLRVKIITPGLDDYILPQRLYYLQESKLSHSYQSVRIKNFKGTTQVCIAAVMTRKKPRLPCSVIDKGC